MIFFSCDCNFILIINLFLNEYIKEKVKRDLIIKTLLCIINHNIDGSEEKLILISLSMIESVFN